MKQIIYVIILSGILFSCKNLLEPTVPNLDYTYGKPIRKTTQLTIANLRNKDIYFARINKGNNVKTTDLGKFEMVSKKNSQNMQSNIVPIKVTPADDVINRQMDRVHLASQEFNNNPFLHQTQQSQLRNTQDFLYPATAPLFKEGEKKVFFVENAASGGFASITATLRVAGSRCYIWVPDSYYDATGSTVIDNRVSDVQIQALRDKFDALYPLMTSIFGYEYWVDLRNTEYQHNRISILLYDIDFDYSATQDSGVVGFFWAKDYYSRSFYKESNELEMFYLDINMLDKHEKLTYSTLIHEFQHMILFNSKIISTGLNNIETWFNEMLSMIAEDVIYPLIEPNDPDGWVMNIRMENFNTHHSYSGVAEWLSGSAQFTSYAQACAFGAFLTRNYGSLNMIRELMSNPYQGIRSVSEALVYLFPDVYVNAKRAFTDILVKYVEVFFDDFDNRTFNQTVIAERNGTKYIFYAFDIWRDFQERPRFKQFISSSDPIRPYGYQLFTAPELLNVTGDVVVNVTLPVFNTDIEYYVFAMPTTNK
ncbi:MAG: M30 family zinc metallopeptidase [Treponemataceae bacterium]